MKTSTVQFIDTTNVNIAKPSGEQKTGGDGGKAIGAGSGLCHKPDPQHGRPGNEPGDDTM